MNEILKILFVNEWRFLTFRLHRVDIGNHASAFLVFAVIASWCAGVGRYWDHPGAEWWQYLGLGSVAYIFVLGFVIWLIAIPLRPQRWSLKGVVTFVGMTSPPAILYSIPVERYFSFDTAQSMNVWFLAIVALWRVLLLLVFLNRVAKLSALSVVVASMLPITATVFVLTSLNLEHVVFRIMGGLAEHERSTNDAAYVVLMIITYLSILSAPIFLLTYLFMIVQTRFPGWFSSGSDEVARDSDRIEPISGSED